jgi:hypothetical protein
MRIVTARHKDPVTNGIELFQRIRDLDDKAKVCSMVITFYLPLSTSSNSSIGIEALMIFMFLIFCL